MLVHECVESRGRKHVLGRLRSICDLQVALGAHHMVVDLKHTQIVQVTVPAGLQEPIFPQLSRAWQNQPPMEIKKHSGGLEQQGRVWKGGSVQFKAFCKAFCRP